MADLKDLWVLPLRCPGCGQGFPAGGEDVLFHCPDCGTVWELAGEALVKREIVHVGGVAGDDAGCFPFWVFPFTAATTAGAVRTQREYLSLTGNIARLPPEREEKPPLVFVPAFSALPALLLRAGRLLTLRVPAFRLSPRPPRRVVPITFREADARTLAEAVVLATVTEERRTNPQFLETFSVNTGAGKLLTLPFVEREGRMMQPDINLEI